MAPINKETLSGAWRKTLTSALGRDAYDPACRQYVNDGSGCLHEIPTFYSRLRSGASLPVAPPTVYANLLPGWHGCDDRAERVGGRLRAAVTRVESGYDWRVFYRHGPAQGDHTEVGRGRGATFDEAVATAEAVFVASLGAALSLDVAAAKDKS